MKDDDLAAWPALVGILVLATLIGGVVLAIYPGWDTVGRFLNENLLVTEQAPAWLQAIGSIVGLFVAIYIPIKILNMERVRLRGVEFTKGAIAYYEVYSQLKEFESTLRNLLNLYYEYASLLEDHRGKIDMAVDHSKTFAGVHDRILNLNPISPSEFEGVLGVDENDVLLIINSMASFNMLKTNIKDASPFQKNKFAALVNSQFERRMNLICADLEFATESLLLKIQARTGVKIIEKNIKFPFKI